MLTSNILWMPSDICVYIIPQLLRLHTFDKVPEQEKWFWPQFRNLSWLSAAVKLGEAPKGFGFTAPLAMHLKAWDPHLQPVAQLFQNPFGQPRLGLIHNAFRLW